MTDQNTAENVEVASDNVEANVEANGSLDVNNGDINMDDLEAALEANDVISGDTPATSTDEITPEPPAISTEVAPAAPARQGFSDRATDMGLNDMGHGCFHYADSYSEVVYRNLTTMGGDTPVADTTVSHIAIFTKGVEADDEWAYIGPISNFYKFEGNGALIDRIKTALSEVGSPTFQETNYLASNRATMRHELVIQNSQAVPQVGDVYPMVSVRNSYDGTKASDITFGMFFTDASGEDVRFGSKNKLGYIRQIHIDGASTILGSTMGNYVTAFTQNIGDMITANINQTVTDSDMMKLLETIEKKAGKQRRKDLSVIIDAEFGEEGARQNITSWSLFNALAKFTTLEKNINAKLVLEDVVERVLVIPEQMLNALATINE